MVTTVPDTLRGFLLPFAAHFRRRGFRVDAMARGVTGCPESVAGFDQVWEAAWSRNPLDPWNLGTARRRVRDVAAGGGYDLVHVHTPVAAFVTRLATLRRQNPVLRCSQFLHGKTEPAPGILDIAWFNEKAEIISSDAWINLVA